MLYSVTHIKLPFMVIPLLTYLLAVPDHRRSNSENISLRRHSEYFSNSLVLTAKSKLPRCSPCGISVNVYDNTPQGCSLHRLPVKVVTVRQGPGLWTMTVTQDFSLLLTSPHPLKQAHDFRRDVLTPSQHSTAVRLATANQLVLNSLYASILTSTSLQDMLHTRL